MAMSDWTTVSSTNVQSFRYDPDTEELQVRFVGGRQYRYAGVPAVLADQMDQADSVGKFFAEEIKGQYETERMFSD